MVKFKDHRGGGVEGNGIWDQLMSETKNRWRRIWGRTDTLPKREEG